jgi:hypothetical protein
MRTHDNPWPRFLIMAGPVWGIQQWRASHQLEGPTVDITRQTGEPVAVHAAAHLIEKKIA